MLKPLRTFNFSSNNLQNCHIDQVLVRKYWRCDTRMTSSQHLPPVSMTQVQVIGNEYFHENNYAASQKNTRAMTIIKPAKTTNKIMIYKDRTMSHQAFSLRDSRYIAIQSKQVGSLLLLIVNLSYMHLSRPFPLLAQIPLGL